MTQAFRTLPLHPILAFGIVAASAVACAAPALADSPAPLSAPGLGEEVYGATVEAHEFELESRYGMLTGGSADGQQNARVEGEYGVNANLAVAVMGEFERAPSDRLKPSRVGIEAIYHLARVAGVDVAAYAEYEHGFIDPDSIETKLLLQRRTGLWDIRFNLIGEKPLRQTEPMGFTYATSVDRSVARNLRLGITAFGDLGTIHTLLPRAEHYVGPVAKLRIPMKDTDGDNDKGVIIEAGYLFAAGATARATTGQFRLNVELEM